MKKLLSILLITVILTSCSAYDVSITPLSEKDSIYNLYGGDAHWQGGEVEEEWHRLHSADFNEAAKDFGYFFGYVTSIESEDDRLMVTVENYGDNIKSGAYRFPVYDSTPIVKYTYSYMKPSDLYVGLTVVLVYHDYSPSDAGNKVNDVIAYTVRIMNNEKISYLPEGMDFVMTGNEMEVDIPVEAEIGAEPLPLRQRSGARVAPTSASSRTLSEKEIARLSPAEFKEWYEDKLAEYLEKNKYVIFCFGYVASYKEFDGKPYIDVANKEGTSIDADSFYIRVFDSTVVSKEGKTLKPSDLKIGQKVVIAYYLWDLEGSNQALYRIEILDTKDKPDPLPEDVVIGGAYIPVEEGGYDGSDDIPVWDGDIPIDD